MLFAVDARSEVHWFYPAYTAEGTNPAAPKLEPTPEVIPLPEGVLAESPATGPMRVVALFAPGEVHVSDVEKLVADGDVKKLNQVSGAVVQVLQLDVSQR